MQHAKPQQHTNTQGGFSLVEVLVSLSIFTIVVGMAVSTTIVLVDANAKAQNVQQASTNLAFALDSMSREIRTGLLYFGTTGGNPSRNATNGATQDCNSVDCRAISFIEAGDSLTGSCRAGGRGRIGYRYQQVLNGSEVEDGYLERRLCAGSWERITAPELIIDSFHFKVSNTDRTDARAPVVIMYAEAHVAGTGLTESEIIMQSSVTQQAIDI